MRRRNVPCSPCSGGSSSGDCCGLKEKLRILWDRTIGSILRINGISPDGDGDFTIEGGTNIAISERGTGNGIRIDTTGGVSYYTTDDPLLDIDNTNLKISTVDVAKDSDLQIVAEAVSDILDGTSTVPKATDAVNATNAGYATSAGSATNATNATNAQYLGSSSSNVGDDDKPIKIVGGQAVPVTNPFQTKLTPTVIKSQYGITVQRYGQLIVVTAESYNHGTPEVHTVFTDMPRAIRFGNGILMRNRQVAGEMYVNTNTRSLVVDEYISGGAFGCLTYLTDE